MALLRKRHRHGLPQRRRRTEPALDVLRGRDDFRLLMLDLAMPADPFAAARRAPLAVGSPVLTPPPRSAGRSPPTVVKLTEMTTT